MVLGQFFVSMGLGLIEGRTNISILFCITVPSTGVSGLLGWRKGWEIRPHLQLDSRMVAKTKNVKTLVMSQMISSY